MAGPAGGSDRRGPARRRPRARTGGSGTTAPTRSATKGGKRASVLVTHFGGTVGRPRVYGAE